MIFKEIRFKIRWWRWFLFGLEWKPGELYFAPWRLDKESRKVIMDRAWSKWLEKEPRREG